jgi:hypothetical protein
MHLSELNDDQICFRMKIIDTLSKAGWQPTANQEIIERGEWFDHEASMQYLNDSMILLAEYSAERDAIDLSIDEILGPGLRLQVYFEDKLDETLDAIVGFQDAIDPDNFQFHVRALVRVCPEVHAADGEDDELWILTDE